MDGSSATRTDPSRLPGRWRADPTADRRTGRAVATGRGDGTGTFDGKPRRTPQERCGLDIGRYTPQVIATTLGGLEGGFMATELEARVEALERSVDEIAAKISREEAGLRELGLRSGSKGVAAAFLLVGGIFLANLAFKVWGPGGELFLFKEFLWLVGLVIVGLLFYFAFIFGYNMLLDYRAGRMGASRREEGGAGSARAKDGGEGPVTITSLHGFECRPTLVRAPGAPHRSRSVGPTTKGDVNASLSEKGTGIAPANARDRCHILPQPGTRYERIGRTGPGSGRSGNSCGGRGVGSCH